MANGGYNNNTQQNLMSELINQLQLLNTNFIAQNNGSGTNMNYGGIANGYARIGGTGLNSLHVNGGSMLDRGFNGQLRANQATFEQSSRNYEQALDRDINARMARVRDKWKSGQIDDKTRDKLIANLKNYRRKQGNFASTPQGQKMLKQIGRMSVAMNSMSNLVRIGQDIAKVVIDWKLTAMAMDIKKANFLGELMNSQVNLAAQLTSGSVGIGASAYNSDFSKLASQSVLNLAKFSVSRFSAEKQTQLKAKQLSYDIEIMKKERDLRTFNTLSNTALTSIGTAYGIKQGISFTRTLTSVAAKGLGKSMASTAGKTFGKILAKGAARMAVGAAAGPVGWVADVVMAVGTAVELGIAGVKMYKEYQLEKRKKEIELDMIQRRALTEAMQKAYQNSMELAEKYMEVFKSIDDLTGNIDKVSAKNAAILGYTNGQYVGKMFSNTYTAARFGKTYQDAEKVQNSYIDSTGRAMLINDAAMSNIFATSRTFGMSDEQASGLYGSMNIFNTSIASGAQYMERMYKSVTKVGLSTKKFGTDLVNNMKLANKYNFKGGVENVMKLTQLAQQTRLNLQSVANFSNTIMEGGIEGALEKSAQLQVLGGNAAMYSNPFSMLYNSNDMEGMMEMMRNIIGDVNGTFNRKTGQLEINWADKKRLMAIGKINGQSVEEMMDMVREQDKQARIKNLLATSSFTDKDKTSIANRAEYDTERQTWVVEMVNGLRKDITDLTQGDISNLLPSDSNESLVAIAQNSLSVLEKQNANQQLILATIGGEKYAKWLEEQKNRLSIQENYYENTSDKIANFYDDWMQLGTEGLKTDLNASTEALKSGGLVDLALKQLHEDNEAKKTQIISAANLLVAAIQGDEAEILKLGSSFIDAEKMDENAQLAEYMMALWKKHHNGQWSDSEQFTDLIHAIKYDIGTGPDKISWEEYKEDHGGAADMIKYFLPYDDSGKIKRELGIQDGIFRTNGATFPVAKIEDGSFRTPNVGVKTDINDWNLSAKVGGPFHDLVKYLLNEQNRYSNGGNNDTKSISVNLSGSASVYVNGDDINLRKLIEKDEVAAARLVTTLLANNGNLYNSQSIIG